MKHPDPQKMTDHGVHMESVSEVGAIIQQHLYIWFLLLFDLILGNTFCEHYNLIIKSVIPKKFHKAT